VLGAYEVAAGGQSITTSDVCNRAEFHAILDMANINQRTEVRKSPSMQPSNVKYLTQCAENSGERGSSIPLSDVFVSKTSA